MATHIHDFAHSVNKAVGIAPQAAITSTKTGTGVDMGPGDSDQAFALIVCGVITDGNHAIAIEESSNDNAADAAGAADPYTAVPGTTPALPTLTTASSGSITAYNVTRTKRYLRAVSTVTTATTGGFYSVIMGTPKKFVG